MRKLSWIIETSTIFLASKMSTAILLGLGVAAVGFGGEMEVFIVTHKVVLPFKLRSG